MRLLLFWETCYRDPISHMIPRQEYIELHLRISKALITPFDHNSAMQLAMKEWDQDTRGTGIMTEQRFIDAMFSTVDLWYVKIFRFGHLKMVCLDDEMP